jgi:3-deoxy-D-manno-octulosonic-acid transferase
MTITLKELTIQEVEFMIGALSAGEYKLVAPLIDKIKVQAIPQAHAILQAEADAKAQELVENDEKATEEAK